MYKNTYKRRSLEDLTLKDNFLFTAVMSDPENCKQLLQIILKVEIDRVEVDYEKCIITHPEYRSIRLDVYVIFICNFDPFGEKKYCYTVKKCFWESPDHLFNDGSYTIFLNTSGTNRDEISDDLYDLLTFIKSDKDTLMRPTENTYIHRLQDSITEIKRNRIWGDRYMRLEELIEREKRVSKKEGYKEGKSKGLAEATAIIKSTLLELAKAQNCSSDFIKEVQNCENLEELNHLYANLLNSND